MTLHPLCFVVLVLVAAAPASAQVLVYGALARDHAASAGEVYEEVIEVHNPTAEPQQARVAQTDYRFAADGTNDFGTPGSTERSNADWITVTPSMVTLSPGETATVTVSVRVPGATPAPAGSYWSMIMIEPIPRGSDESTLDAPQDLQYGVVERVRYGVQIATHVGAAVAAAEVVAVTLEAGDAGTRVLSADVINGGTGMLDGPVYIDVFDASGEARGRIDGTSARIYPGTSFRHRVDLGSLEPGVYEALLVIDGGEAGVFGAQYTLEL